MLEVEYYERIRRMYYIEGKSQRDIAKETGHGRRTVKQVINDVQPPGYRLKVARGAPMLGAYLTALNGLLEENKQLPHKQRRTVHKMWEVIRSQGYQGSESTVNSYAWKWKRDGSRIEVFLPLEFDPGTDAQVDWGRQK